MRTRIPVFSFMLVAVLISGCASRQNANEYFGHWQKDLAASPLPIFAGPAGVLFTNLDGRSARVSVDVTTSGGVENKSGWLGGGRIVVLQRKGSDLSFAWDIKDNAGYILSEALQGYAVVPAAARVTNVFVNPGMTTAVAERMNGVAAQKNEVLVAMADGTTAKFNVWRATEGQPFPVRIDSVNQPSQFSINLSDFVPENAPMLAFPPPGFTKYADSNALMTELMARRAVMTGGRHRQSADSPLESAPGVYRPRADY